MKPEICILTPEVGYKEKWERDAEGFRALFGKRLAFCSWTDPGDLSGFRLILPLLAWGYQRVPSRWYQALDAWEVAGLPFANDIATLRWNTDKDYLLDLELRGIPIVPTIEVHGLTSADLDAARDQFGVTDLVVKPSISGGADGTHRLQPGEPIPFDVLEREMLIQPMMPSIAQEGEFSLFIFGGKLSHAILKTPSGDDFRVQEQFGGREVSIDPPASARELAEAVLAALPEVPLYARVDMLRDWKGAFCLMELELIEPSLFLGHAGDAGAAFAAAVIARV